MVKTEGLLLVIALLAISTGAFPTSDELLRPADAYSSVAIDPSSKSEDMTKEKENEDIIKEKENVEITKVDEELTNKEKEKVDHAYCNHHGPHNQSHIILLPVTKLVIQPAPAQTVMIYPLDLYGDWYDGYGAGYERGYTNGIGYGLDPIDYNRMRREIAADSQADLTIANNKETPEELILPTKEGTPDDLAPPTREGATDGALTDEELSELARCGYGGGFGGGFNRPIIIPVPVNQGLQPSFVDVNLSRMNSLNTNNRPTIDLLTLLRLLG